MILGLPTSANWPEAEVIFPGPVGTPDRSTCVLRFGEEDEKPNRCGKGCNGQDPLDPPPSQ